LTNGKCGLGSQRSEFQSRMVKTIKKTEEIRKLKEKADILKD